MIFGETALKDARGAILAHSVQAGAKKLRKGRVLSQDDIENLQRADIHTVWTARLEADDVHEDEAAGTLAAALIGPGISARAPFTGRANLHAEVDGLIKVDQHVIAALNNVDEGITVATVADYASLNQRSLIATIKIIPYAVSRAALDRALALLTTPAFQMHRFQVQQADLIVTETPGTKQSLTQKGTEAVRLRLAALGTQLATTSVVAHEPPAIAAAIKAAQSPLVLILGASATSDRHDVCPAAVVASGGQITRFGMPVDPGNLLFMGQLGAQTVVGLPGCVRSPALNGADWVLQRCVAGLEVTSEDIAAMGVGGLLKEISTRPQPRQGNAQAPARPKVSVLLLAGGKSSRMGAEDKLMRQIDGQPLLHRAASQALASEADEVVVVLGQAHASKRKASLAGLDLRTIHAPQANEGMGASIRAGMRALAQDADAVVLAMADMPDVTPDHYNRLIAGFDPSEGRSIARAQSQSGKPGHPVLFGRRFFEALGELTGDEGARRIVKEAGDYVVDVPTPGEGALTDLDTLQDWEAWEAKR